MCFASNNPCACLAFPCTQGQRAEYIPSLDDILLHLRRLQGHADRSCWIANGHDLNECPEHRLFSQTGQQSKEGKCELAFSLSKMGLNLEIPRERKTEISIYSDCPEGEITGPKYPCSDRQPSTAAKGWGLQVPWLGYWPADLRKQKGRHGDIFMSDGNGIPFLSQRQPRKDSFTGNFPYLGPSACGRTVNTDLNLQKTWHLSSMWSLLSPHNLSIPLSLQ